VVERSADERYKAWPAHGVTRDANIFLANFDVTVVVLESRKRKETL
jgi:hypothetical protein